MPYLSKIRLNGVVYDLKTAGQENPVTGVKGDSEDEYRTGNVNITKENIGLGDVCNFKAVSTEADQGLSNTEKTNARTNIGLGTAATRSVPTNGNANATQVVLGNDSRLSDARPASDVYEWAKAASKPSYSKSDVGLGNVPNVTTNNQTPTFTEASTRANIASGETLSTLFGKIKKFFSDLKTVAFTGSYSDLSDKPTAEDIGAAPANHVHNYAGSDSAGGPANLVHTPRSSNGNYNSDLPGANKTQIVEHGPESPNRPSDHWYYVITMQGSDTAYGTQLAYGMTTTNNYVRTYQGGSWTAWKAFKSQADIDAAVSAAKVGNATAADVRSGKTFTNSSSSGLTGTFAGQEKTVTAGTSASSVTPDSGKYLSKVTVNPTPSQTKSATPSTSAQTISPDSGKLLSSVTVNAISPNLSTQSRYQHASDNATPTLIGDAGYFNTIYDNVSKANAGNYFEIRYNGSKDKNNNTMTNGWLQTNTLFALPSQTKSVTAPASGTTTVSPDANKVLQSVTVSPTPSQSKTVTPTSRSASAVTVTPDSGKLLSSVVVNTNNVPNTNSGTYTPTTYSTAEDMTASNTYRYINTTYAFKSGVERFMRNLSRFAYWFTINNAKGGDVTIESRVATFTNFKYGFIIVIQYSTNEVKNIIVKWGSPNNGNDNGYIMYDMDGGTVNRSGIQSIRSTKDSLEVGVRSDTELFLNAYRYNF